MEGGEGKIKANTLKNLKREEKKKMRKTFLTIGLIILSIAFVYGTADALVSGVCSGCHTMHNSQGGSPMAVDNDGVPLATAQPNLTKSTCIGCHKGGIGGAPVIFGAAYGTDTTAGGSFNDAVFTSDAKGHNVSDLSGVLGVGLEGTILTTPGNANANITVTPTALTCAGAAGCHGDHDSANDTSMKGIKGFHHGSKQGYRFLQTADTPPLPIAGKGSSDWEKGTGSGATASNHNVYSAGGSDSISTLCAQCHEGFHGTTNTNSESPFKRHPTENLLSDATGWDLTTVNVDYNNNPFAFGGTEYTNASTGTAYTTTGARVACISCHRAHGTPNDDILRFAYNTQKAGEGTSSSTGCLGCHHLQR